jgi:hypothetical protein
MITRLSFAALASFALVACTAEVQTRPITPVVTADVSVQEPVVEAQVGPPAEVTVQTAPPAAQVEVVPVAPSVNHVWIAGHWHWAGRWVWVRGHYVVRRVGMRWVPAHYVQRGGAYIYVGGHWAR